MNKKQTSKYDLAQDIVAEMKQEIGIPYIDIRLNPQKKATLTDSKFGGLPYWDMRRNYPTTSTGNKLTLIAQINLDHLNRDGLNSSGLLPKGGMLQFFLCFTGENGMYGMDFDDQTNTDGFRVVYHEQVDYEADEAAIRAIGMPTTTDTEKTDNYCITGECALDFADGKSVDPDSATFSEYFLRKAHEHGWEVTDDDKDLLDDDIHEATDNSSHRLLGYPFFTQADPREEDGTYNGKHYDILLFQMDTDNAGDFDVMWGDCGIANFFISREHLKQLDFSDILYNWDCC